MRVGPLDWRRDGKAIEEQVCSTAGLSMGGGGDVYAQGEGLIAGGGVDGGRR